MKFSIPYTVSGVGRLKLDNATAAGVKCTSLYIIVCISLIPEIHYFFLAQSGSYLLPISLFYCKQCEEVVWDLFYR